MCAALHSVHSKRRKPFVKSEQLVIDSSARRTKPGTRWSSSDSSTCSKKVDRCSASSERKTLGPTSKPCGTVSSEGTDISPRKSRRHAKNARHRSAPMAPGVRPMDGGGSAVLRPLGATMALATATRPSQPEATRSTTDLGTCYVWGERPITSILMATRLARPITICSQGLPTKDGTIDGSFRNRPPQAGLLR